MSLKLTSPNGDFSRDYASYEEMVEKLDAMDGMPDHLALDGRLTTTFARVANMPTNKKVEAVKETLAKSGFRIEEYE